MRIRSLARDDSGASLVEAALVFPLFLAMLLATLEIGFLGFTSASFENAVAVTARLIRTGQGASVPTVDSFKQSICSRMVAPDCVNRLAVDVRALGGGSAAFAKDVGNSKAAPSPDADNKLKDPQDGAFDPQALTANTVVVVTASFRWRVWTPFLGEAFPRLPGGDTLLISRLLFKNEPFND